MKAAAEKKRAEIYAAVKTAALKLYGLCPDFTVKRPKDRRNGDFSASAALVLGGALKRPPVEIAAELAAEIELSDGEVKNMGKGFLNFFLEPSFLLSILEPKRETPEISMKNLNSPDFYPSYIYNRLKKLLELHGFWDETDLKLLTSAEETALLWALAEDDLPSLIESAADFYDKTGIEDGLKPLWGARSLLMNNALNAIYCNLRKE